MAGRHLWWHVGRGHKEITELLISNGAKVNQATTDDGWTALMVACLAEHQVIAELLISHGATVNHASTDKGWTALMAACQVGHKEIAKLLISHGATLNQATTVKGTNGPDGGMSGGA